MTSCVGLPAKIRCSTLQRRLAVAILISVLWVTVAAASVSLIGMKASGVHIWKSELRWAPGPPATHVYFLKTHKCASTTLQRIILMYGIKHNLSFALPANGRHQFWPRPFNLLTVKRSATYPHFDIMAFHVRYSPSAVRLLHSDTIFLSIVRDPAEHLQSLYEYYQVARCYRNATFEQFVHALDRNRFEVAATMYRCPFSLVSNMQMYDFGYDGFTIRTKSVAKRNIRLLDRTFHLILVAELFDESLALMGDLLHWSTADLVYFKANARSSSAPIADDIRQMIYRWNWADKMLYDHFRSKLERELAYRRAYVRLKVEEMASLRASWHWLCVKSVGSCRTSGGCNTSDPQVAAGRPDIAVYELSDEGRRNDTCSLLVMPELDIIQRVHRLWPEVSRKDDGWPMMSLPDG